MATTEVFTCLYTLGGYSAGYCFAETSLWLVTDDGQVLTTDSGEILLAG